MHYAPAVMISGEAPLSSAALSVTSFCAVLSIAACNPPPPRQLDQTQGTALRQPSSTEQAERPSPSGPWSDCYSTFTPSGSPKADLLRLTRACGPIGGMRAITPITLAQQRAEDPVDRYTFFVAKAGACYRVYAAGDRNVQDLDLLLRGPDGADVMADITHDSWPIVPPHGPVCFDTAGLYLLEVSVFQGSGRYAIQIWGKSD